MYYILDINNILNGLAATVKGISAKYHSGLAHGLIEASFQIRSRKHYKAYKIRKNQIRCL